MAACSSVALCNSGNSDASRMKRWISVFRLACAAHGDSPDIGKSKQEINQLFIT